MITMAVAWLGGALVAMKYEKVEKEENSPNPKITIQDFEEHNKRYFIKDGKLVDRDEHLVEGYEEVKKDGGVK